MAVDLAKRRRVMQRSMKLGHCICQPRRPCPCDVFTEQGLCPCAGERPAPGDPEGVKLTQLVRNAGCASKIPAVDLEQFLARLPAVTDPAVLSGIAAGDDAGIYRLSDDLALVQTIDVMTPCVDDPEAFGQICAANCLSDIYAMGGRPLTALSILCFPSETLDGTIMYRMLRGAMAVFAEAGVALIGGHSVKDDEIKLGFAITGTLAPTAAVHRGRAAVGDSLVLTKPLGTGVVGFCRQIGRTDGLDVAAAERAMRALNRDAAEAMTATGASAATDITGFGFFGHLIGMLRHSGATGRIFADALPAFGGVLEALRAGVIPGAIERNSEYVAGGIHVADGVEEARVLLGFDAQTSGGLLIAIAPDRVAALQADLARRGAGATLVGLIVEASEGIIEVVPSNPNAPAAPRPQEITDMPNDKSAGTPDPSSPCCNDGSGSAAAQAFRALMGATAADGAVDAKTKELITFSLVVMARCGPCIQAHLKKAAKMGLSQAELDEAAWLAVAIGGAPVKMFYDECLKEHAHAGPCCP